MCIKKRLNKIVTTKWLLGMVIILFVGLNSCTKEDRPATVPTSNVLAVNALASATSTPANFYLDSFLLNIAAIAYGNTPTYAVVKPTYQNLTIKNATTGTSLLMAPVTMVENGNYAFFLYGTTAAPSVLITKDTISNPASGKAKIRLVQLGQSIGSNVDLALRNDYQVPAVNKIIFSNATYPSASSFVEVDTCSSYSLQIFATGTTTSKASSSKINLLPGINYTILVRGISGGTPALAIQAPINNTVF